MDQVATKAGNPLVEIHDQMEKRTSQFQAALPAHIPVERFKRVLLTAIQNNMSLATADRITLFNAAMRAAQDGLLPDGREGAMVIYKTKIKQGAREFWVEAVQWMPMIAGIRKKVRNSGEISTWDAHAVYEKDQFDYELGDEPMIKHKPFMGGDPGKVVAAYSIARLKSGEKSFEVMPVHQIERVRAMSKNKDRGPWVDHYAEMCRKTVARRHSKVLPMSTDLDDLMRRDDDLYDIDGASDKNQSVARPQLADFANMPQNAPMTEDPKMKTATAPVEKSDPETGEIIDDPSPADAYRLGCDARNAYQPRRVPPEVAAMGEPFADAWQSGWTETDEIAAQDK